MKSDGNLLVLGAHGMLGRALVELLEKQGRSFHAPGRADLDLTDPQALASALESLAPSAILNAAAFTDVAAAEDPAQKALVMALNRDLPARLGVYAARRGIPVVQVSTDFVYDGRLDRPYLETDATAPLQMYGRSKLEGERELLAALPEALIARTSTLYGPGERPRPHYVDAILAQARTKESFSVVETPISSPTCTTDLAVMLLALLDAKAQGVVHTVNDGGCSRYELAKASVEEAGLSDRSKVLSRPEPEGGLPRPARAILDVTHYRQIVGIRPRPWREALREYVRSGVTAS